MSSARGPSFSVKLGDVGGGLVGIGAGLLDVRQRSADRLRVDAFQDTVHLGQRLLGLLGEVVDRRDRRVDALDDLVELRSLDRSGCW